MSALPGWYGKLPALGDFASRRLPASFVRPWDDWLQQGLAALRDAQGDGWLDLYLVAPVRRFWLAPGLLGARAWVGLLMPSVDAVGRHFPLTVATPLARAAHGLEVALAGRAWYDAAEGAARQVLDITFGVDDFERALTAAPPRLPALADRAAAAPLAAAVLELRLAAARSVWWCDDARQPAQFLCFDGLPDASHFGSLLATIDA